MKLTKYVVAALIAGASVASADIRINWSTPSGFTLADGTTPMLGAGNALFQLIYSPDNVAGQALATGVAENDIILEQVVAGAGDVGDPYGAGFTDSFSQLYSPGFAYIRVFQSVTGVGNTPIGTFYFTGPLITLQDVAPSPALPQEISAGGSGSGTGDFGTIRLNQQVVPEPMSIAFLGIGAALVAVRRVRKA